MYIHILLNITVSVHMYDSIFSAVESHTMAWTFPKHSLIRKQHQNSPQSCFKINLFILYSSCNFTSLLSPQSFVPNPMCPHPQSIPSQFLFRKVCLISYRWTFSVVVSQGKQKKDNWILTLCQLDTSTLLCHYIFLGHFQDLILISLSQYKIHSKL